MSRQSAGYSFVGFWRLPEPCGGRLPPLETELSAGWIKVIALPGPLGIYSGLKMAGAEGSPISAQPLATHTIRWSRAPRLGSPDASDRYAMKRKTLLSWSTGKDSAWTLHVLRRDPRIEIAGLFTVLNERYNRVSMHATRVELLYLQAEAAGLPLETISLPDPCTNEQCDAIMGRFAADAAARGIQCIAFGDLFLEEVRRYREKQMQDTEIEPLFPLWRLPAMELIEMMLSMGLEAYISSVDLKKLPVGLAGRQWTRELLQELPAEIDPTGENGEIHTIVVNGPMFARGIPVEVGEVVERNGFAYADIIPLVE